VRPRIKRGRNCNGGICARKKCNQILRFRRWSRLTACAACRLSELAAAGTDPASDQTLAIADDDSQGATTTASTDLYRSDGIDKSALAVAAPRRYRNREHLRAVAKQPCLICGRKPSDPHHLRYLQPRALGRNPAMNSRSRSAASIIARSIAPVTSKLGGRQAASTQSRSPVSCGMTPASMRGGSSLNGRRKLPPQCRKLLPRMEIQNPLGMRWRLRRRPDDRRDAHPNCGGRRAFSHRHRHGLCRCPGRWAPGNLAHPQQALSWLAASPLLRGYGKRTSADFSHY
jgi:hypothetical protein